MKTDVAICQTDLDSCGDACANLERLESVVAAAAGDVAVLPELFATGFGRRPDSVAETMEGPVATAMKRWARQYGKAVAGSVAVAAGGEFRNRMMFVEPSGRTTCYDKHHLFSPAGEQRWFARGDSRTVVEYGGVRYLLAVCYDLRFPVWCRCRGDYDAIICSASWDGRRRDAWRLLLRARAVENQCFVIGVNRCGCDGAARYDGDSAVIDFAGRTLTELGAGEGSAAATIDLAAMREFRESFAVWRDADDFELK